VNKKQLRKQFEKLVNDAIEMYPHGNDGMEAADALIEFWMENRSVIKWAFWHGEGEQNEIIDCYGVSLSQIQIGGKNNSQVIT
jgi:hypothetical protein